MLQYFIYLIFILSVAMAAGGIVLSTRLRDKFHHEIFSTLLYFQVFIFAFGFYGIWGQAVIKVLLESYISEDLMSRFSDIAMLLGLPFLVFAWLMLIQFACGISGRKSNKWLVLWFLLFNFTIIIVVGYFIAKANDVKPVSLIRNYFIVMNLLYSIITALIIYFPNKGKSFIHDFDRRIIAPVIIMIMILQGVLLLLYKTQISLAAAFILAFFAGNTFLPIYLNYGTLLSAFIKEPMKDLSFEEFCKQFEVSPRETDIVREICNGLSNKEISDKLFISLQTVKDHTHRIYIKTNVKSRVQLINLVKEAISFNHPPTPLKGG
ncbi:MAG: helix-turn-helix transcriptional regulator [Bacteroidales bacterium]|nr:helix-turn-helix transcriptional regulator [Bacteroidales bacterium]